MSSSQVIPTGWLTIGTSVGSTVGVGVGSLVALDDGFGVALGDAEGAGLGVHPARRTVPTDAATISAKDRDERGKENKEAMYVSLWGIGERYQAQHAPKLIGQVPGRGGGAEQLPIESSS